MHDISFILSRCGKKTPPFRGGLEIGLKSAISDIGPLYFLDYWREHYFWFGPRLDLLIENGSRSHILSLRLGGHLKRFFSRPIENTIRDAGSTAVYKLLVHCLHCLRCLHCLYSLDCLHCFHRSHCLHCLCYSNHY